MKYWLHRITGGENAMPFADSLLFKQGFLSIGWSDFSADCFVSLVKGSAGWDFMEAEMKRVGYGTPRNRYNLWRFIREMKAGDIVIVPTSYEFSVFKIADDRIYSNESMDFTHCCDWYGEKIELKEGYLFSTQGQSVDLGFYRKVEKIAIHLPRQLYADQALTSRMKIRQTNVEITDLKNSIDNAVAAYQENKPLKLKERFIEDSIPKLLDSIRNIADDRKFEALVEWYLKSLGAKVETPSKNESPTVEGDADKIGYFDTIKAAIMVQAKKHSGTTDDWAIEQIKAYRSNHQYGDYSTQMWVISTCDMFSERAMKEAEASGIRLIDGKEFCRMILDIGLKGLNL